MAITLQRLARRLEARQLDVETFRAEALGRKVSAVGKAVITGSPIDTGRFVGGWRTSINTYESSSPSRTGKSIVEYRKMKRNRTSGKRTAEAIVNAEIEEKASLEELKATVASIKPNVIRVFMANNVPYAGVLASQGAQLGPRVVNAGFIGLLVEKGEKSRSGKVRVRVFNR